VNLDALNTKRKELVEVVYDTIKDYYSNAHQDNMGQSSEIGNVDTVLAWHLQLQTLCCLDPAGRTN
jgi:hypothetical protein